MASAVPGSAAAVAAADRARYTGRCHCGRVEFECGRPVRAPVCHCHSCQSLHGAPFVWSVVLRKDEFRWLRGYDKGGVEKFDDLRYTCRHCHGKVVDEGEKYFYSFPSVFGFGSVRDIPSSFRPTHHCFYNQRIMDVHDDKPKFVAKWGSARCDTKDKASANQEDA